LRFPIFPITPDRSQLLVFAADFADLPGMEKVETLVIGAGQAGLVMSHRLKQRGLSHLVLERHRIAERWRSERWDGLKFQFPNWSVRLPEFSFAHTEPDAFASTGTIVDFIDAPMPPLSRRRYVAASR